MSIMVSNNQTRNYIYHMDESSTHMTDAWPDERRRVGNVTKN